MIGWILVGWCGLGICFAVLGFANKALSVETYQGLPDWMVAMFRLLIVFGTALALFGIFAGWRLRQRRRVGLTCAKLWAMLSLISAVASITIQIAGRDDMQMLTRRQMMAAMEQNKQSTDKITPEFIKGIWATQVACGGIMGFVPPVVIGLMLISKSRREEAAGWPA